MQPEDIQALLDRPAGFYPLHDWSESAHGELLPGRFFLVVEGNSPHQYVHQSTGTAYLYTGQGRPTARQVKDFIGQHRYNALALWYYDAERGRLLADLWNSGGDLHLSVLREERALAAAAAKQAAKENT